MRGKDASGFEDGRLLQAGGTLVSTENVSRIQTIVRRERLRVKDQQVPSDRGEMVWNSHSPPILLL